MADAAVTSVLGFLLFDPRVKAAFVATEALE